MTNDELEHAALVRDATRYRRLRILGVPKMTTGANLDTFTNLDEYVDADLAAHPSRGEVEVTTYLPPAKLTIKTGYGVTPNDSVVANRLLDRKDSNDVLVHSILEGMRSRIRDEVAAETGVLSSWLTILEEQQLERRQLALTFPTVDPDSSVARNAESHIRGMRQMIKENDQAINTWIQKAQNRPEVPIPMLLFCPGPAVGGGICGERHIDVGDFATKPHKTHTCQRCGFEWKQTDWPTVGVQFLPGHQNKVK